MVQKGGCELHVVNLARFLSVVTSGPGVVGGGGRDVLHRCLGKDLLGIILYCCLRGLGIETGIEIVCNHQNPILAERNLHGISF